MTGALPSTAYVHTDHNFLKAVLCNGHVKEMNLFPPDAVEAQRRLDARTVLNAELRAVYKEDPSSLSADDRARAEQLLARDARKAAKKAARASESA